MYGKVSAAWDGLGVLECDPSTATISCEGI